ncbi:dTDP-4-dehydrorhamnose reductase family protein [Kiloniella majae]|uniref:dTDP-4-dehydrorhamnose reductase family protein n=1 Tax=Kiloniella majae TaxID=1938558 RepID=UPI000A278D06|nr:SDR family oxidoreductase [Kiloniella majae]
MKVLVLGANGMLGHKLVQVLVDHFDVAGTVRHAAKDFANVPALAGQHIFGGVDAEDFDAVTKTVRTFRPDVVLNCIGVVKQLKESKAPLISIRINSIFPHLLAELCTSEGVRLVHFSTDCVFSGTDGPYSEEDNPDPVDLYGRTKLIGEVSGQGCLTIRTSIVGRELNRHTSLIDWLITQQGNTINGFSKVLYTGLTTQALSKIIGDILLYNPDLEGVLHVSSDSINKFELLSLVNSAFSLNVTINDDDTCVCDRRLNSAFFRNSTGYSIPSWNQMIRDMANDTTQYPLHMSNK